MEVKQLGLEPVSVWDATAMKAALTLLYHSAGPYVDSISGVSESFSTLPIFVFAAKDPDWYKLWTQPEQRASFPRETLANT